MDKSRKVILPVPAVEVARGMRRAPDHGFRKGFPFGLRSWEDPGGFGPWRGQGSSPPSNIRSLLAAHIGEGIPRCLPEVQLAISVRRLQAYGGKLGKRPCRTRATHLPAQRWPPEAKTAFPLGFLLTCCLNHLYRSRSRDAL